MGAATYLNPEEAYAVTPSALTATSSPVAPPVTPSTPDILNAGGPPPINALTLPAINYPTTDPNTGLTGTGTQYPVSLSGTGGRVGAPTGGSSSAGGAPTPITTDTRVATKVATPATSDPYTSYLAAPTSYGEFRRRIIGVESGGRDLVNPLSGALGPYQVMPSTVRDPGFGIQGGDPNNPRDVNRVGEQYLHTMYNTYGPVLGAVAYNAGPGLVNRYISEYGDPRKGQISMEDWISKLPNGVDPRTGEYNPNNDIQGYVHRVAGGSMALPGQTAPDASETATAVGRPSVVNPLAMHPQTPSDIKSMMHKYWTLAALQTLLPAGFAFHKSTYDPREVLAIAKGQFSGVRGGTMPMAGMPRSFGAPIRPVLGAGAGPSVTAYSPATVPGFTPVRRRG